MPASVVYLSGVSPIKRKFHKKVNALVVFVCTLYGETAVNSPPKRIEPNTIGDYLRHLRLKHPEGQRRSAHWSELIGKSNAYLHKIEKGVIFPSWDILLGIYATLTGIDIMDIRSALPMSKDPIIPVLRALHGVIYSFRNDPYPRCIYTAAQHVGILLLKTPESLSVGRWYVPIVAQIPDYMRLLKDSFGREQSVDEILHWILLSLPPGTSVLQKSAGLTYVSELVFADHVASGLNPAIVKAQLEHLMILAKGGKLKLLPADTPVELPMLLHQTKFRVVLEDVSCVLALAEDALDYSLAFGGERRPFSCKEPTPEAEAAAWERVCKLYDCPRP
jgi:hypothetical protein